MLRIVLVCVAGFYQDPCDLLLNVNTFNTVLKSRIRRIVKAISRKSWTSSIICKVLSMVLMLWETSCIVNFAVVVSLETTRSKPLTNYFSISVMDS